MSLPRGQGAELARRVGVYGCYITIQAILEPQYRYALHRLWYNMCLKSQNGARQPQSDLCEQSSQSPPCPATAFVATQHAYDTVGVVHLGARTAERRRQCADKHKFTSLFKVCSLIQKMRNVDIVHTNKCCEKLRFPQHLYCIIYAASILFTALTNAYIDAVFIFSCTPTPQYTLSSFLIAI